MDTATVIGLNGMISAVAAFTAYYQATKKNKTDFLNNQISILEADIDSIKEITYKMFEELFINNTSVDESLTYRTLTHKNNTLHNKVLALNDFKQFSQDVIEYNIFSSNVLEANDKNSAESHLNTFDELYITFKDKIYKYQNQLN